MVDRPYGTVPVTAGGSIDLYSQRIGRGGTDVIELYVAQFMDDPDNDYPYARENCLNVGAGDMTTEQNLLETVQNFGRLWAHYYESDHVLSLQSIYQNNGVDLVEVTSFVIPIDIVFGEHPRTYRGRDRSARTFELQTLGRIRMRGRHRPVPHVLILNHIPDYASMLSTPVTPTSGGFDVRDREMMAYLSDQHATAGSHTGICGVDCTRFSPDGRISEGIAF